MRTAFAVIFMWVFALCGNELGELLRLADESNPVIQSQRAVVEQTLRTYDELREFLDPSLYLAAGGGTALRGLPVSPDGYSAVGVHDSLEGRGGVLVPVEAGGYISFSGVSRRWFSPDDDYEKMYQNLVGLNLSVPLLRDRGFALYGHRRGVAMAACNASVHRLLASRQEVRRNVELAYIQSCLSAVNAQVWSGATERFQLIYEESSQLSEMKVIPEYQVQTALRELQGGRADEVAAERERDSAQVRLTQAVGVRELHRPGGCTSDELLDSALALPDNPPCDVESALRRRGEYLALCAERDGAEAALALEDESRKDSLTLNAGVTWQGDSRRGPFGDRRLVEDHNWGGEVMVVWSRPLDYAGSDARLARAAAKIDEIDARIEALAVQITAELRGAELRVQASRRTLEMILKGVEAARKALEAEQERFRLGESTSAIVLDAQKELNNMTLRQSAAAAELLAAYAELQYALGYPPKTE